MAADEFDPESMDDLKPFPEELHQLALLFRGMGAGDQSPHDGFQ